MKKLIFSLLTLGFTIGLTAPGSADQSILDTAFSFDAQKIAYTVANFSMPNGIAGEYDVKSVEIWTCNRDGSNVQRVTTGHRDIRPRWSPDNKQIVFTRKEDVWIVNADGSGLKQLNKTPLHIEKLPEFSNDGKSLFYVRTEYTNVANKGEKEIFLPGTSHIVAYSLIANQERERFKSEDEMLQIIPNRADANEVFLLYKLYDPKFKTDYGDGMVTDTVVLAAAKLDGSGRRILKTQPKDIASEIEKIHAISTGAVIYMKTWSVEEKDKQMILIPNQNGTTDIENPLIDFNDISMDGKSLLGIGIRSEDVDGEWITERTVKIVDAATEKTIALDLNTLYGKKPAAVVSVPTPKKEVVSVPKTAIEPSAIVKEHLKKGEAALVDKFYGVAIDEFSQALDILPDYAPAYYGLGRAYAGRSDREDAIKEFDTAIRLNPNELDYYLERAITHFLNGNDNLALVDYDTAIRLFPESSKAYTHRFMFYDALGQKDKAKQDEDKAKELEKLGKKVY